MKLTLLGTGTSIGVPAIGCHCEVCRSRDGKDKRLRTSAILETEGGLRVLLDCSPDFRQQILRYKSPYATGSAAHLPFFDKFDGVFLTHIHYDHVGGTDDLRPFASFGDVDIYAQQDVIDGLHQTMPYCFKEVLYPGVPHLKLHQVKSGVPFTVSRPYAYEVEIREGGSRLGGEMTYRTTRRIIPAVDEELTVMPVRVMHGTLPILGYRIGSLAYITDMKEIDSEGIALLRGVETLVVNALRFERPHHSHQLVDDAMTFSREIGASHTFFIHLTHDIGTHSVANKRLPDGFEFGYDNQIINC